MAWIKSCTELESHHKTIKLQLILGMSRDEVIGFLHRFWWRVLTSFPNGEISLSQDVGSSSQGDADLVSRGDLLLSKGGLLEFPSEFMAEALTLKLDVAKKRLKAMIDVGFLEENNGKIFVHDWLTYAGRYIETNKLNVNKPKKHISTNHLQNIYKQNVENLSLDKDIDKEKDKKYIMSFSANNPVENFTCSVKDSPKTTSEIDIEKEFEEQWKIYPRPERKKEAFRYFQATVKNKSDLENFTIAIKNYINSVKGKERQFIQLGSTFFNNWQDYINLVCVAEQEKEKLRLKQLDKTKNCQICHGEGFTLKQDRSGREIARICDCINKS